MSISLISCIRELNAYESSEFSTGAKRNFRARARAGINIADGERESRVSPIAARIKATVGAGAFKNSEPGEVVLKRATVSVTVLLAKEARPRGGYDPRDPARARARTIPRLI